MVERGSHTIASDHLRLLGAAQNTLATPAAPTAAACIHSNHLSHYVRKRPNGQKAPKCHLSVTSGWSGSWRCGQYKAILSIIVNACTQMELLVLASVSLPDRVWSECSEYGILIVDRFIFYIIVWACSAFDGSMMSVFSLLRVSSWVLQISSPLFVKLPCHRCKWSPDRTPLVYTCRVSKQHRHDKQNEKVEDRSKHPEYICCVS